ncbi:MAG: O-antigen ligase family protein [Oscillospiraceae bacterium]
MPTSPTPMTSKPRRDLAERYGLGRPRRKCTVLSTKAAVITNVRTIKINYCRLMLNTEPLTSRLFGLSYDEMTYHGYCYDVENDFHGIAYLYGWAGLACLLAFLGYFPVIIVCALIRNARRYFTVEAAPAALRCAPPSPTFITPPAYCAAQMHLFTSA